MRPDFWLILNTMQFFILIDFFRFRCRDYVTEQFFNMHNLNMIPVVLGGANYSAIAPPHSFIDAADFPKYVQSFTIYYNWLFVCLNAGCCNSPQQNNITYPMRVGGVVMTSTYTITLRKPRSIQSATYFHGNCRKRQFSSFLDDFLVHFGSSQQSEWH